MNATTHPTHPALVLAGQAIADGRLAEAHRQMRRAERAGAPGAELAGVQRLLNRRRAADLGMQRLAELERGRLAGVPATTRRHAGGPGQGFRISRHAIDRWRERVGAGDREQASAAIADLLRMGRVTGQRPRWASNRDRGGTRYVIWHERPGIALVTTEGVVTTVLTREAGRRSTRRRG
jgi:hypothetical protein